MSPCAVTSGKETGDLGSFLALLGLSFLICKVGMRSHPSLPGCCEGPTTLGRLGGLSPVKCCVDGAHRSWLAGEMQTLRLSPGNGALGGLEVWKPPHDLHLLLGKSRPAVQNAEAAKLAVTRDPCQSGRSLGSDLQCGRALSSSKFSWLSRTYVPGPQTLAPNSINLPH